MFILFKSFCNNDIYLTHKNVVTFHRMFGLSSHLRHSRNISSPTSGEGFAQSGAHRRSNLFIKCSPAQ